MASWPGDRLQGGLSWWRGRERRRPLNSGAACVGCLCHRPALWPSRACLQGLATACQRITQVLQARLS